jgi:hypothetical protein
MLLWRRGVDGPVSITRRNIDQSIESIPTDQYGRRHGGSTLFPASSGPQVSTYWWHGERLADLAEWTRRAGKY